ncbi:methyltransferase domain-containing protein, partial [Rudaea sp.]|uniref:methyltransferase domain-containing protein n=1 Tax=Rudaea sp. TaxID=2136325 RepID=UPI002ED51622
HEEAVAAVDKAVELAPNDLGVLEAAVAVANQAGIYSSAERHLRAARALQPQNPRITRALAVCLFSSARYGDAEPLYRELLGGGAQNPVDLASLGECLIQLQRRDEAIAVLERALALAPGDATIRFNLALARGETPDTQPNEMTQALFDDYSKRFDKHLVGALKYRVPKRVAEMVRERHSDLRIDVLDLGCGTGLTGVYLGGVKGSLVGVDLSAGMIEQARRHAIYTRLVQDDLRVELRKSAAESYDCVIANDVFIYVGEIAQIVADCFRVLRRGGLLIFSCETAADDERGFVLRPSKRYAHSRAYIERLCRDAGFAHVAFENIDLRQENQAAIPGFIAVAERV